MHVRSKLPFTYTASYLQQIEDFTVTICMQFSDTPRFLWLTINWAIINCI